MDLNDKWSCFDGIKGAIVPKKAQKRTRMDYSSYSKEDKEMEEAVIQSMAEQLCIRLGISFIRLPDPILGFLARNAPAPIKMFVAKYLRGFPDLVLMDVKTMRFYPLELKVVKRKGEKNGGLSSSQLKWWAKFGMEPNLAYGWKETEAKIMEFHCGEK